MISLARALSHDGLENAFAIAAIHAGAHANPTFAGDTLAAQSEVIGLRQNASGTSGVVYVASRALNQEGRVVIEWARWVMVAKRDIRQIPSQYPFVLVDRVLDYDPARGLVAVKNVSGAEDFFEGHFPGAPVMPGVLIMECLAQAAGIWLLKSAADPGRVEVHVAGIDAAKFRRPVVPGDCLRLEVRLLHRRGALARMAGEVKVGDQRVVEARLLLQAHELEPAAVDPTARVSPEAQLGPGVRLGPYAVIGPHVRLGAGSVVESHVVIQGRTTLGAGNPPGWTIAVVDGALAYTIATAAATSTDGNYGGVNPAVVSVSNSDNDAAGITVNPTAGLVTTEAGGTAQFTVVLQSQPTANVTIGLSSSDVTEGTVAPASVTFTSANWNVAQTVAVTGVDDAVVDGAVAYTIATAAATSRDGDYGGANPSDVSGSNSDSDAAGTTVNPTAGLVT